VLDLIPSKRVEWECISVHPESSPASAWTGTRFTFELAERAAPEHGPPHTTTVDFRQVGYDARSPHFETNKAAWGEVLQNLKRVVESGRR
jgi:hypothetical protein